MASKWDLQNFGEVILSLRDFNENVEKRIGGFEGVHDRYGIGKRNVEGRRLLEFCDEKNLCVANTLFEKKGQEKITSSMERNETEIDFVLVDKSIESI